ncbi:hypothetical protein llap_1715 [Limosa lapponica baueri]|uniref:Uncharacterized protein n=1 Tax=Limosa lapponica baueri TaxID=1758121 RepID=A0A2I0UPN7_LIMLA|nr:hypothetical protein llap_1715 [Limosa lapponica baueri]
MNKSKYPPVNAYNFEWLPQILKSVSGVNASTMIIKRDRYRIAYGEVRKDPQYAIIYFYRRVTHCTKSEILLYKIEPLKCKFKGYYPGFENSRSGLIGRILISSFIHVYLEDRIRERKVHFDNDPGVTLGKLTEERDTALAANGHAMEKRDIQLTNV